MNQIAMPVSFSPQEVARKTSLGAAIELCAEIGGKGPKEIQLGLKLDKAQWSRWTTGQEGVVWPKFRGLMDLCGNDAPLLWMNYDRGYDISLMHKRETDIERENRLLREQVSRLEAERMIERRLVSDMVTGRGFEPRGTDVFLGRV